MATYYVRQSGGSDGNTGLSFALGWATVQYAADNASAAGDIVLICADASHVPAATIDFDTNSATEVNPITFRGASATGVDDGTVATISGASLPATSDLLYLNANEMGITFENLRITSATRYGINIGGTVNGGSLVFKNVRIDNSTSSGIYDQESNDQNTKVWLNCEIDNNVKGLDSVGVSRGGQRMINCSIHDNTSDGVEITSASPRTLLSGCLFFNNGAYGVLNSSTVVNPIIINCIFFNNTSGGLSTLTASYAITVLNCIFRSNGGYGINTNTGNDNQFALLDYNCFSNNTSGHIDIDSGTPPGDNNILDDPDFTSEVDGSEDFTLKTGSPCIDVGYGYNG